VQGAADAGQGVGDITSELADGVKLLVLVERLSGLSLGKYNNPWCGVSEALCLKACLTALAAPCVASISCTRLRT
jgi:hypothetical protein